MPNRDLGDHRYPSVGFTVAGTAGARLAASPLEQLVIKGPSLGRLGRHWAVKC
jgi:hypothetical protein